MLIWQICISAKLIHHSSHLVLIELSCQTCVSAKLICYYSSHLTSCICSEGLAVFQGHDHTRGTLTPVAQQRRHISTKLTLDLESDADSAQWEALVRRNEATRSLAYHTTTSQPGAVTHPQDTEEVEAGMEAELVWDMLTDTNPLDVTSCSCHVKLEC